MDVYTICEADQPVPENSWCGRCGVRKTELCKYRQKKPTLPLLEAAKDLIAAWDAAENQPIATNTQRGIDYWNNLFTAIDNLRNSIDGN